MPGMRAVSYTHLDVYKRQEQDPDTGRWLLKKGLDEGKDQSYVPVSYTHLDVYKRQLHGWCFIS